MHRIVVVLAVAACGKAADKRVECDEVFEKANVASLFSGEMRRTAIFIDDRACYVYWELPEERAANTISFEIEKLRHPGLQEPYDWTQDAPGRFSVTEREQGNGFFAKTVLSVPTEEEARAASEKIQKDTEALVKGAGPVGGGDPIGTLLSQGPSDLHEVTIDTSRYRVKVQVSRYSSTRELVKTIVDRVATHFAGAR